MRKADAILYCTCTPHSCDHGGSSMPTTLRVFIISRDHVKQRLLCSWRLVDLWLMKKLFTDEPKGRGMGNIRHSFFFCLDSISLVMTLIYQDTTSRLTRAVCQHASHGSHSSPYLIAFRRLPVDPHPTYHTGVALLIAISLLTPTIQFPPSLSNLLFISPVSSPCAPSKFLLSMLRLTSTIFCTVSSFNKSSLFKWSKRRPRRFSVSSTSLRYDEGALDFTRCMSAFRIW